MRNRSARILELLLVLALVTVLASCDQAPDDAANESGLAPESTTPSGSGTGEAGKQRAGFDPWNLVVITMDTTRADALGAYGQVLATTPHLDRLAEEGVLFEQVSSASPFTLPSHATIFTGRFPFQHGARGNEGYALAESNRTLAEVLEEAGYRTGAEIAASVLQSASQIAQGYRSVRDTRSPGVTLLSTVRKGDKQKHSHPVRVGRDISRRGIEFIRKHKDQPFHLWLHYFDPHQPYSPTNEFRLQFPDSEYLAEVASMDAAIGRVTDEIERLGIREKTLVVLTSDHGEALGDHGEITHGYFVYESTIRVPWILWGPKALPAGRRIGGVARTVDIAPTVLDLMNAPALTNIAGVSLKGAVLGAGPDPGLVGYGESFRFTQVFDAMPLRFIREGRWKYIHKVGPELFDLEADPKEWINLASGNPDVVQSLRERLRTMIVSSERTASSTVEIDARTRAELAALGYSTTATAHVVEDEVASLEIRGVDVSRKIADAMGLAAAEGKIGEQEFVAAISLLKPLLERNPNSIIIQGSLGHALSRAGHPARAEVLLRRVVEADPCADVARSELNQILKSRQDFAEAIRLLSESPSTCPDYAKHRNNLAWLLATLPDDDLRDGARALEMIREVVEMSEGQTDLGFLDTLAAAHAEVGEFDEAVRIAEETLQRARKQKVDAGILAVLRSHRARFEAKKPIREP